MCCQLILTTDKGIQISGLSRFYDEIKQLTALGVTTDEYCRLSMVRHACALCNLMAGYGLYPSSEFYYLTNGEPKSSLLLSVPIFTENGNLSSLVSFVRRTLSIPYYNTLSESMYLRELGYRIEFIDQLIAETVNLDELCIHLNIDTSEGFVLYEISTSTFMKYKTEKYITDFAALLWHCYVGGIELCEDEVSHVSIKEREIICMNLAKYLVTGELNFIDEIDTEKQIKIMTLMVISRNLSYFPSGLRD